MWRPSVSVALITRCENFYKLLCLKRSNKLKFMPGKYVFPGGVTAKIDFNLKWYDLYGRFGVDQNAFNQLKLIRNIPEILQNDQVGVLPKYIAFRLAAIRETFEESAIILCKNPPKIADNQLIDWQTRVNANADLFYDFCDQFNVYPDLWLLKDWSLWMTPKTLPLKFETIFYFANLDEMPSHFPDGNETDELRWETPEGYLRLYKEKRISFPPPQFYEISRLRKEPNYGRIVDFAGKRAGLGHEKYFPHPVATDDALYALLPGDGLYPASPDTADPRPEYMRQLPDSAVKHRMDISDLDDIRIVAENFEPIIRHLVP